MARFTVITGKNEGAEFQFSDEREIIVGREGKSLVRLNDLSVSRRHCLIEQRDGKFFIRDLQSLNGSSVNGKSLTKDKEIRLKNGDKVRVGDFVLLFSDNVNYKSELETVVFDDSFYDESKTLSFNFEEVVSAMARDLAALLKISESINTVRGLENLQEEILRQILETIPADEAAILFCDDDFSINEIFGINLREDGEKVCVSRTIVNKVLRDKTAIMLNDAAKNSDAPKAESLIVSRTRNLLCVPLILFENTVGAIVLNSTNPSNKFDENHLRFLTAVAAIASVAVENVRNTEHLERENARLREENSSEKNMLGESPAMQKFFEFIEKAAPTDATILLTGESGTGKELAARAIHQNSRRRNKSFVAVNCAALTETLLESELFGHEKGAFTGAVTQKPGKIETASGGTLFLDEVGEMPLILQAKLLRVLQEREFERVGGTKTLKADIRLVSATNRDLETEVANGNFRQDLFYRLNVVVFKMPPLRERREDIPILAEDFLKKFSARTKRKMRGISARAKTILTAHDYPGNVRELENAIERAVVLGSSEWLLPEDLPEHFWEKSVRETASEQNLNYQNFINEQKKKLIRRAFDESRGSYVEAAKLLEIHPNYLHRLIKNLDIKDDLES